jgi:hypothetical protein
LNLISGSALAYSTVSRAGEPVDADAAIPDAGVVDEDAETAAAFPDHTHGGLH